MIFRPLFVCSGLLLAVASGCGGVGPPGSFGFGSPTLEITVGGVHVGTAAPDASSIASLIDQRDSGTNALISSTLTLDGTVASHGASCSMAVHRIGGSTAPLKPIGLGSYQIAEDPTGQTADLAVDLVSPPTVTTSTGTLSCAGSACDGFALSLSVLDSTVTEGYFMGTLVDGLGSPSDVVCAFYLPTTNYQS